MDVCAWRHGTFADHDRLSRGGETLPLARARTQPARLRLLCAHYLTQAETRGLPPPKPVVWAKVTFLTSTNPVTKGTIKVPIYPVSPQAPVGARALPPQELAHWLVTTLVDWLRIWDVNQRRFPRPGN